MWMQTALGMGSQILLETETKLLATLVVVSQILSSGKFERELRILLTLSMVSQTWPAVESERLR